ncbi:MAG: nucleoside kinase [Hornefia sp.]|nr:nucleoside kinase [Hornefia sp.]
MKILFRLKARDNFQTVDIPKGYSAEKLYGDYEDRYDNPVLLAKINNKYKELTAELYEGDRVELLDIKNQGANLVHQNSLSLLYCVAIRNLFGDCRVNIDNSLNQGLYTKVTRELSDREIASVSEEMRRLAEADMPIKAVDKGIYELDGYREKSCLLMVPSTGYLKCFEVRKYKKGVLLRFPLPGDPKKIPEYRDQPRLYEAFEEQSRWNELLGVDYVEDLNRLIEKGDSRELIMLSEALHEKKIAEIADMIKSGQKRIILIAGPSSSGKTTFARRLCVQLKVNGMDALYLGTDDYFVDREDTPLDENGEPNYEGLDAIDTELFNSNMNDLLSGKSVDLPTFNFITGVKEFGKRITRIEPGQPIVIEGIHGLNDKMTLQIPSEEKFKIYISPLTQLNIDPHTRIPTTDERILRRMVRDHQFRNNDAKGTISDWPKVRAGEDKNIFPYNSQADVLFNSYHVYEIAVLKKYAKPMLEAISQEEPEYAEARRLLSFLDFFVDIEDESAILSNSIIREFIGGSVYVD